MNIYIVTRYVTDATVGTPIPNLGVHTSQKSALKHYDGVIEDRIRIGARVLHNRALTLHKYNNRDMRDALIINKDGSHERLKIEVWKVGKR